MKAIIFDSAKCNGCYGCQLACKDEHVGNDWSPISASEPDTGAFWCKLEETTHGQVPKVRVEYKPVFGGQNPEIAAYAPEVMLERADGIQVIAPDKAKGRKDIADKFEGVYWNEELQIPQACTMCAHLVDEGELPHCVDVCATGALRFGDVEDFAGELAECEQAYEGGVIYYKNLPKLFISGDVWDPQPDEIIENAEVTLIDVTGAQVATTRTDGFGDFWFRKLDAGTYRVRVEAAGYEAQEREVVLDKSLNIGDFPLKAQA